MVEVAEATAGAIAALYQESGAVGGSQAIAPTDNTLAGTDWTERKRKHEIHEMQGLIHGFCLRAQHIKEVNF